MGVRPAAQRDAANSGFPRTRTRSEVWSFVVSPEWNIEFEGLPAVMPEGIRSACGASSSIRVPVRSYPARRATGPGGRLDTGDRLGERRPSRSASVLDHASWTSSYRSTQGGRHTLSLPAEARVTAVRVDGRPVQIRPNAGKLSINLLPGAHAIGVSVDDVRRRQFPHAPGAGEPQRRASNVSTTIRLPEDRWLLWVSGPGVGPAVLYWSELVVFLATAVLLGRWKHSPLRTHEWLLLGLGLSTLSWWVLVLVGAWLFALRWRESWSGDVPRLQFNFVQAMLAALTSWPSRLWYSSA